MKRTPFLVLVALLMALPFGSAFGVNQITLDKVTNNTGGDSVITDGYIPVGDTAKFIFRWTYEDGTKSIGASSNGFQVYEKNDGDFFPITWDTLSIGWTPGKYTIFFFNDFSVDGMGADTIGFAGVDFMGMFGIPLGMDTLVWYIESGSDNAGDTLCIDSSWYPPGGAWTWSPQGGGTFEPDWGGPYCFLIKDSIEVQPELVISPDTLYYSAVEGGANPAADSFEVSEIGGGNIAFSVTETAGWFNLNKAGGTTPEQVTVNVGIIGLSAGDYIDSVEVSSGVAINSPQWAYVILEVTPAPKYLAVTPDTLFFTAVAGDANPAADSFEVSETGGGNIAFGVAETVDWFDLNKTGGTTPEYVTVNVDITGLSTGVYLDSVTVSSGEADNTPQFAYVRLEVTAAPQYLAVTPDTLYFTAIEGGVNPAADSFEVSETGGGTIAFAVAETVGWFDLNKTSGTTPEQVTVNIDITGLSGGVYLDSVTVSSGAASNSPQFAYIVLAVAAVPKYLAFNPDTLHFTAVEAGANPAADSFEVSETGGFNIAFDVAKTAGWFDLNKTSGITPEYVGVTVNTSGLTAANYFDSVLVTSAEADNSPEYAYMALEVTPAPNYLAVSPDTLYFTATEGDANPAADSFEVSETGGGTIAFAVAKTAGWFGLNKADGTTPEYVTVSTDITGLTPDNYFDSVEVSSGEADNSPIYAFILLMVSPMVNNPPVLDSIGPQYTNEGDPLTFQVTASDPETTPMLLAVDRPTGANLTDNGNGTADFLWVPDYTQEGVYYVTFIASDGILADSELVEITVYNTNRIPELGPIADTTAFTECEILEMLFQASDPDGDAVALGILETLPTNMSFTDSGNGNAVLNFAPDTTQDGVYPLTVYATDGPDTAFGAFTIVVEDCIILSDTTFEFTYEPGTDPDTGSAELVLVSSGIPFYFVVGCDPSCPDWLTIDPTSGRTPDTVVISYDASALDPGHYEAACYVAVTEIGRQLDMQYFTVSIDVVETACVEMKLSDTVFHFVDTLEPGDKSNLALEATLDITSSGEEFNFVIYAYDDTLATWLTVVDSVGRTPLTVTLTADGSGLAVGTYENRFAVLGDETVCDPNPQFFHVRLDVVDTTSVDSLCYDSMMVAEVMTVPGAPAMVPVDFTNCCDLSGIGVVLSWGSDYVELDSVSFVDSRLVDFPLKYDTIDNVGHRVAVGAANDGMALDVPPETGNFVNLHFSVLPGAPHGFYEIGIYDFKCTSCLNPVFSEDCGEGPELIIPGFEPGGILVDTTTLYFCGYVVDPDGNPIPEATVELWVGFPYGSPDDMTLTNSSGAFAFTGFAMPPFDLWAYHEGYYPALIENINALLSDDTTIVLYPVEPVTPTQEWVLFYCSDNTYMGEPLPIGSVVDAFDPEGTHCGTFFVHTPGQYGYLLVYRDDPYYPNDTTDEGAEPDDLITFTVNGIEALVTGDPTWTYHGDTSEVCLELGVVDTIYCDLFEGWNLVSWNLDQESDYIVDALASISGCVELVMGFEQGGLIYDPGLPEFSNLWQVDHLSGYWIKTSCNTTLEITGMPVAATTPIALTAGWNLVSYLPDFPMATGDALASLGDKLIVALGYENDSGSVYLPGEDLYNSLDTMASCLGYWVKILQDTSLVYPGTFPVVMVPQKSHQPVMSAAIAGVTATNRWVNVYSRNLTLDGATVAAGATITAHNLDGRIIGSFTTIQEGQFGFMPVYADDNATTEIEGVRAGERFYLAVNGVAANETFIWTETGDRMEIGSLTAKAGSQQVLPDGYSLYQNYPNPFNPSTNISFTLPIAGQARIDIYNILGKLVATPFNGTARTGENNVVWDGRNYTGENVATGIYFYRLTADNYVETKKMTLMK